MQVNRNAVRRKRDVRTKVRGVFFGPSDLSIVLGDPEARRRFMEECVVALWPLKEAEARAYDKVVRQRNRLLKDWEGSGAPPDLDAWDDELVAAGSAVTRARGEAMQRVAPAASEHFRSLAGYALDVTYLPSVDGEELDARFRERLAEVRKGATYRSNATRNVLRAPRLLFGGRHSLTSREVSKQPRREFSSTDET